MIPLVGHLGDRLRNSVAQYRLGRDAHLSGWVIRSGDDLTRFSLDRATRTPEG